jgi:raffinose/stachyose/melibiose transport system permease protein
LYDNLWALILIYTAMGIPFSILIIVGFMKDLPEELAEAAKMDGCNDLRMLWTIFVPLIRPAIVTAVIYNFIPIWNDFFFPLIFIESDELKTVQLGTALFFGQYQTQWPLVFSALTLAVIPPLILYLLLSKHFIKGLTSGAIKG